MGSAVWLFMWLLDKVTSIDEKGTGKVLGGKPIKFEEVETELGISQDTYTRWIQKLSEYPYIETTRTPYGITFKILKTFKHFKKRFRKNAKRIRKNAESRRENAESNKTIQLDNTIDTMSFDKFFKKIEALYVELYAAEWGIKPVITYGAWRALAKPKIEARFKKGETEEDVFKSIKKLFTFYVHDCLTSDGRKKAEVYPDLKVVWSADTLNKYNKHAGI